MTFRRDLEVAFDELRFAASGSLLAPPLEHPRDRGQSFFCLEGAQCDLFPPGRRVGIRFEHYEVTYE